MKTIYTLITYVPGEEGWHDRCGDYHSGKESECQIHYFNDPKQAGEALGHAWFNNGAGENTFLINGINPQDWYCILSEEEGKALEDDFFDIDNLACETCEQLKKDKQLRDLEEKNRKQREKDAADLRAKMKHEEAEKAQLAILMAKYSKK